MQLFDDINVLKYCYLATLSEPEDNCLRIVLEEARADGPVVEHGRDGRKLAFPAKAIETTPGCARFEIHFDSYIAYAVRDESYAQYTERDAFEGVYAQIYSQSLFLDFVSEGTFATADYPGPFVHYGFSTLNHLVDVVSCKTPRIECSTITASRGEHRHANWQRLRDSTSE
jgi:hypothetical protein